MVGELLKLNGDHKLVSLHSEWSLFFVYFTNVLKAWKVDRYGIWSNKKLMLISVFQFFHFLESLEFRIHTEVCMYVPDHLYPWLSNFFIDYFICNHTSHMFVSGKVLNLTIKWNISSWHSEEKPNIWESFFLHLILIPPFAFSNNFIRRLFQSRLLPFIHQQPVRTKKELIWISYYHFSSLYFPALFLVQFRR